MTKTRDLADLGGGFIQAGTGAVQRTVESKLQDVVSVKDFGAVGDGVADDTAAIQAALDWVSSGPNRCLEFAGNSTYKITATLNLTASWPSRQCLINGNGARLVYTPTTGSLLNVSGLGISTLTNFWLYANTKGTNTAIYAKPNGSQYAGQSQISNINIQNFGTGIYWGSDTAGANGGWSTNFIDLDVSSCNIGLHLADGGNNALTFIGNRYALCGKGVVISGSCYGVKFVGGVIEFHTTSAVEFSGSDEKFAISFDGIYFENSCSDFVFTNNTSNLRNLSILNCYIFSSDSAKAAVSSLGTSVSASDVAFRNNFIYLSASSNYGTLPDDTLLDSNFSDFTRQVAGTNLIYAQGRIYGTPVLAAGVTLSITTNQASNRTTNPIRWCLVHNNNDGGYTLSGYVFVTQGGFIQNVTQHSLKASGAAAAGTVTWDSSGGFLRFNYTPPAGVTTNGTGSLEIRNI